MSQYRWIRPTPKPAETSRVMNPRIDNDLVDKFNDLNHRHGESIGEMDERMRRIEDELNVRKDEITAINAINAQLYARIQQLEKKLDEQAKGITWTFIDCPPN